MTTPTTPNPAGLPAAPFAPGEVRTVNGVQYAAATLGDGTVYRVYTVFAAHGLRRSPCAACYLSERSCRDPDTRKSACGSLHHIIVPLPILAELALAGVLK